MAFYISYILQFESSSNTLSIPNYRSHTQPKLYLDTKFKEQNKDKQLKQCWMSKMYQLKQGLVSQPTFVNKLVL